MELASIKSYQRTIASVSLPLQHFVETGFWNPYTIEGWTESDIGDIFVRRACREVARELKRPFIQCYAVFDTAMRFSRGYVQIPKRQRLAPLAAPLLLLPDRYHRGVDGPGFTQHLATLWQARIHSEELWNQYYDFILNDPECRKARRLTS